MTLRWRIASILAVVALGVGAFAAIASYVSTASQLRSGIDETLKSRAAAVTAPGGQVGRDGHSPDGHGPDETAGCASPGSFQPASAAQLVTSSGVVMSCIEGGPVLPLSDHERALAAGSIALRNVKIGSESYRLLSTPLRGGGTLQIARSLSESEGLLTDLRFRLAILVAVATAIAAALGWAVASRIARPIVRLRDTTHRIASTLDLSTPIDVEGPGEVGSLAASFATMVAAVSRSQEAQRRLVSDASHEMRTPLTSLRSNMELIDQIERLPKPERREVIADVLEDVDELSSLLGELVDLASDLATAEVAEVLRLGDLARTVAGRTLRRSGRAVSVDDASGIEVTARPRQLERAISNLVDNAAKYSDPGTPIEITVEGATVTVSDRGRGIPEDDVGRIFDRFYRAIEARAAPGSGLGLSIVDEIVRSHGGHVFARNREGGGAEVGFSLRSA